jgi:hypothetical protein
MLSLLSLSLALALLSLLLLSVPEFGIGRFPWGIMQGNLFWADDGGNLGAVCFLAGILKTRFLCMTVGFGGSVRGS